MAYTLDLKKYLSKFNDIKASEELPLIGYDNEWPLPDKLKIERYTTKLKINNKLTKVKRLRLVGRILKNSIKPLTKKWYKGNLYRYGLKFYYKNKEIWVILKSNWPTSIEKLSLKIYVKDSYLFYIIPKNYVGVWYKYGVNRINFIIIPRRLKLNNLFWETFGILYGEMLRKGRRLAISNTEPLIINTILKFFEETHLLPKSCWNFTVSINSKNLPIKNKKLYEKKIKDYWINKIKISPVNIRRIYWYNQFNSTLRPNFGKVNLEYNNLSFFIFILKIVGYVEKNVSKKNEFIAPFMRGLIAGEGGSDKKVDGSGIGSIRIASKYEKERKFYAKLCEKLGLKANLDKGHNMRIFRIENFIKSLEYRLFDLNLKRKKTFLINLYKMSTINAARLLLEKPLSVKEIVKKLKLNDYRNINKNFSKLFKKGYLKREYINKCFIYKITPKLKTVLTLNNRQRH